MHVLTPLPPLCLRKEGEYRTGLLYFPPLYEVERGNKKGVSTCNPGSREGNGGEYMNSEQ